MSQHTDNIEPSALGETLIRWGKNQWAWKDGTPAPEITDLTLSDFHNFRCRSDGTGATFVEVPVKEAPLHDELRWVAAGGYDKSISGDDRGQMLFHPDGRVTRRSERPGSAAMREVWLVPIADWDERPVCGAGWKKEHEAAILAKARTLLDIPEPG